MEIPFHIQEIAKLYPIFSAPENNLADGKIENWYKIISDKSTFRPGEYVFLITHVYLHFKTAVYNETWVYLGNHYFKQVLKKVRP
jgi:hypothetical protein